MTCDLIGKQSYTHNKDKKAHNKEVNENAKERKKREFECEAEKENVIKEVEQKPQKAKAKKVKYPVEDLDVPPDIKSMFLKRPSLRQKFSVPQECVGTMLAIWNFLIIFGRSLFLSFCTLDDFELSLCHNVASPRCNLVVEMHVALLNAIIRDRWLSKGKRRQIVPRKAAVKKILQKLEQKWDKKPISLKDGRKGWVSVLIGCIQQVSKDNIPSESISETNSNEITLVNITTNDLMTQKHKLEEEQAVMQKREEEIEIEKRKYAFPRTTPLGYDRFYNKYYYFDCIGEAVGERYGAGRIFVEIPGAHDLQAMTEKEEQRFNKRRKGEDIDYSLGSDNQAQWGYYEDASQIDELQRWLNTKGSRELALNNELTAYYRDITSGMSNRQQDIVSSRTDQDLRRSRRTIVTLAVQSCMKWSNKLAQ
ncbi:2957_t:CDS:2 [Cetraspora pellucida]|uniref:2957_t:CDS:1 n=1 Tax=Cetraspora pellucida TaxID=1433469 RepID=A0A9N9DIU2_9GLOM|nr:2957_t:CDS:2 [Cetraspora pellucida]